MHHLVKTTVSFVIIQPFIDESKVKSANIEDCT